jgi:hypothetical protein
MDTCRSRKEDTDETIAFFSLPVRASTILFASFMSDRHLSSHHRLQASFHGVSTSDLQPQALSSVYRLESNPLYVKKAKDIIRAKGYVFIVTL